MEFKEAMRTIDRMCSICTTDCSGCQLEECCPFANGRDYNKIEAIVTKWAAEHPEKTRLDDFLDKYPRAALDDNDTPRACAKNLGYCTECIDEGDMDKCDDCWRRPLVATAGGGGVDNDNNKTSLR